MRHLALLCVFCLGCEEEKLQTKAPLGVTPVEEESVLPPEASLGKCTFKPQVVHLEAVPTALLIMMDRSNSMEVATGTGSTRWQAVSQAVQTFMSDARTQSLHAGLSFFPVELKDDPPKNCSVDEDCGLYGPCFKTGGGGLCLVAAGQKPYASCDFNDYVTPALAPARVSEQGTTVINTFSTEDTWGNTPTGPALAGGIAYLNTYAAANPNARIAMLLATDGEPTECAPQDKTGLAAIAKAGFDSGVRTFVIGVGVNSALLNSIALAGSGDKQLAFLIDGKADVAGSFLGSLREVRAAAKGCDFQIKAEGELDVSRLSLSITTSGKSEAIPYVQVESGCTGAGWFYRAAKDGSPLAVLCPASCADLQERDNSDLTIGDVCLSEP